MKIIQYFKMTTDLTKPDVFGPGVWFTIHLYARNANTPESKSQFVKYMTLISENLPCLKCREHCQKYLKDHPIDSYWKILSNDGVDIGIFKWTWLFHNAVNSRLGKPIVDWKTAYEMYFIQNSSSVCSADCDKSQPDQSISTIPSNTNLNKNKLLSPSQPSYQSHSQYMFNKMATEPLDFNIRRQDQLISNSHSDKFYFKTMIPTQAQASSIPFKNNNNK